MYCLRQVKALNEPAVTSNPVDFIIRPRQLRGYAIDDGDSNDKNNVHNDFNDDKKDKTKDDDIFSDQDFPSSDRYTERVSVAFLSLHYSTLDCI